jgi:undecaprenyl-diphosphatase
MTTLEAVFLALIQVFTEFLPVSSSGHLVIAQAFLGITEPNVTFNVLVHLGTLGAIIVYFLPRILTILNTAQNELEADVFGPSSQLVITILVANVPAGLVGFFFQDQIERLFSGGITPSIMFLVTALVLFLTRFSERDDGYGIYQIPFWYGVIVGVAQAIAIMPGISRSGFTISFALFLMIQHEDAATFSFLLSIPAISGAAVLKFADVERLGVLFSTPYVMGFLVSFAGGLVALALLMYVMRQKRLYLFSYYLFAAGLTGVFLFSS